MHHLVTDEIAVKLLENPLESTVMGGTLSEENDMLSGHLQISLLDCSMEKNIDV